MPICLRWNLTTTGHFHTIHRPWRAQPGLFCLLALLTPLFAAFCGGVNFTDLWFLLTAWARSLSLAYHQFDFTPILSTFCGGDLDSNLDFCLILHGFQLAFCRGALRDFLTLDHWAFCSGAYGEIWNLDPHGPLSIFCRGITSLCLLSLGNRILQWRVQRHGFCLAFCRGPYG